MKYRWRVDQAIATIIGGALGYGIFRLMIDLFFRGK